MLRAAIGFFIIGLVAFAIGAGGIGGLSMEIGRTILFVFIVLAILSFLASMFTGKKPNIILVPLFIIGLSISSGPTYASAKETKANLKSEIGDLKTDTKVNTRKAKRYVRNKTGRHSMHKDTKDMLHDTEDKMDNSVKKLQRKTK